MAGMSGWGKFVKRSVSVKNNVRQITAFNLCIFSGNHTRSILMDLLGSNSKLLTSAAGGLGHIRPAHYPEDSEYTIARLRASR